jgi:catechol 2,3-dioxygenase-like lactoylglutathione lyase family enzyme
MSTTDASSDAASPTPGPFAGEWRLEVVALPVADVDRAKDFYANKLGWRLDADFNVNPDFWVVQVTPPGSLCSIHFGKGITALTPGSIDHMYLVVADLAAARAELVERGVDVSEIFHLFPGEAPQPGPSPDGGAYTQYISFDDPDGNRWLVQEISTRLPGR